MRRKYNWTQEQDDVIAQEIRKRPFNLESAFTKAAEILNLESHQVRWRYQNHIKKTTVLFMIISDNDAMVNTKIIRKR